MIQDTFPDHSGRSYRNETLLHALKSIGDTDIRPIHEEGWLDDLYETDCGPDDDKVDAEDWMDDYLDDAA